MSHSDDQPKNGSPANPVALTIQGVRRPARHVSRREALQWVMSAVAAAGLPVGDVFAADGANADAPKPVNSNDSSPQEEASRVPPKTGEPGGYGTDPNLTKPHKPGDLWPLTFNEDQRVTATALADLIIPKDQYGPAASEVGVIPMFDEWISAPYPQQQSDRAAILPGLAWLEEESKKRFKKSFAELSHEQQTNIADDICFAGTAKPQFKKAATFFTRFRNVAAGAYYGTPAGWEAIGYVGNVPLASFDGPPPEVLEKLGVTQTVS